MQQVNFRDVNLLLFGGIPLFFFFTFRFFKNDFPLFLKNRQKKKFFFFRLPTLPLSTVRRASVNSRCRLGLPVCASSVSGRCSKVPYLHSPLRTRNLTPTAMLRVGVRRGLLRRGWWCGGEGEGGDGFVAGLRTGSKWSQEFYPSKSSICTPSLSTIITLHTHSLSPSLSLSLTHTHWHSGLPAAAIWFCCSIPQSVIACYTCAKNATITYRKSTRFFSLTQRLHSPSSSPPPLPWSKQSSAPKSESSIVLD